MEENVNEVLGINTETSNINDNKGLPQEKAIDNSAENTLSTIANIILVLGIISTLICAFTICFVTTLKPGYSYVTETTFNPVGFATTIAILLSSLASWSIMKVIANISLTIKEMNKKIK